MTSSRLPIATRRALFAALVHHQDSGLSVDSSRSEVCRAFAVSVEYVKEIQKEGIKGGWLEDLPLNVHRKGERS